MKMESRTNGHRSFATRTAVASYESYADAQSAVDHLSDEGFPVERVSIVADDLRFVEDVTGRFGYGRAALGGLSSGAGIGALFGFVFGLFSLTEPFVPILALTLWGLVCGAVVGLIVGLVSHAFSGGRRDFSSVGGMQAGRYEVMADEEVAHGASQILAEARLLDRQTEEARRRYGIER